jgi:hypothetical protein
MYTAEKYQYTTTGQPEVVTNNIFTCSRPSDIRSDYHLTIVTTILHVTTHTKANKQKHKEENTTHNPSYITGGQTNINNQLKSLHIFESNQSDHMCSQKVQNQFLHVNI